MIGILVLIGFAVVVIVAAIAWNRGWWLGLRQRSPRPKTHQVNQAGGEMMGMEPERVKGILTVASNMLGAALNNDPKGTVQGLIAYYEQILIAKGRGSSNDHLPEFLGDLESAAQLIEDFQHETARQVLLKWKRQWKSGERLLTADLLYLAWPTLWVGLDLVDTSDQLTTFDALQSESGKVSSFLRRAVRLLWEGTDEERLQLMADEHDHLGWAV